MQYNELQRKINGGTILPDQRLWLVDVRYENIDNKPLRNVPPTQVVLADNPNRRYHMRQNYTFLIVKPNGEISAKHINIYPSVYRSRPNDSIYIFLTKEEAEVKYREQCVEILRQAEDRKAHTIARFDEIIMDTTRKLDSIS
jgi:hypothetical protein